MSILITQLVARVIADTTEFTAGMAQVQAKTAETAAASNASMAKQGSAARRMSTLSKVAVGGVAIGVYKAVKSFADYDHQMNITQALTGANKKEMDGLRETSIKLGADVRLPGVSAADVAKGMQEMSRAGMNVQQVQKGIEGTMLLGTAAQIDYGEAAKITSQALNTFGLEASKSNRIADLFAATANASQGEVGDVADAFRYSASQAQLAGVGIEDLTLLIGRLSNNGVEASVAGTALRAMFTRLAPQTTKQTAAWEELGLMTDKGKSKMFDATGKFVGIRKAADLFHNAIKGLSEAQRTQLTHQAFGAMATRGYYNAFKDGAKGLDEITRKEKKAGGIHGAAARVAKANSRGLYGAMQALQNVAETLGLILGREMAPYVIEVANAFTALLQILMRHPVVMKILAGTISLLTIAMVGIKIGLMLWNFWNGQVIQSMIRLTAALATNPLFWIALAIVGVILVLRHFGVSLKDVTDLLKRVWNAWLDGAKAILEWFKSNWQTIAMWILLPFPMLVKTIIDHWDTIKRKVTGAVSAIWSWVTAKFWDIVHFIERMAPVAYDAAHHLGERIADGVIDGLGSFAKRMSDSFWSHVPGGNYIQSGLRGVGGGAQYLWTNGETSQGNGGVVRHRNTGVVYTHDAQGNPTGARGSATRSPSVYIQEQHIHNDADADKVTTIMARKVNRNR